MEIETKINFNSVKSSVDWLVTNHESTASTTLSTTLKYLENLIKNTSNDPKFCSINCSNAKFREAILRSCGLDLLLSIGFRRINSDGTYDFNDSTELKTLQFPYRILTDPLDMKNSLDPNSSADIYISELVAARDIIREGLSRVDASTSSSSSQEPVSNLLVEPTHECIEHTRQYEELSFENKSSFSTLKSQAQNGDIIARGTYSIFLFRGFNDEIKDIRKASSIIHDILPALSTSRRPCAGCILGYVHLLGIGEPVNDAMAFNHFKDAAIHGCLLAQVKLANCYQEGIGCQINPKNNFSVLELCNNRGSIFAKRSLALLYKDGIPDICPKDPARQLQLLREGVARECPDSMNDLACALCNASSEEYKALAIGNNNEEAFNLYKRAVALNNYAAMTNLAGFLKAGKCGPVDIPEALRLYTVAADHGIMQAQFQLGMAWGENGWSGASNLSESFRRFSEASENGSVDALFNIGISYYYGHGVGKDVEKALSYFVTCAEKHGFVKANLCLGTIYEDMGFNEAALHQYTTAAAKNSPSGMVCAASMHERGIGCVQDHFKAFALAHQSAETGCALGQLFLSRYYENGVGVSVDMGESMRYLNLAADQNQTEALYKLGLWYENGSFGLQQNYQVAMSYYEKAIEQGNSNAMWKLAGLYHNGFGVVADEDKAKELLKQSGFSSYDAQVDDAVIGDVFQESFNPFKSLSLRVGTEYE